MTGSVELRFGFGAALSGMLFGILAASFGGYEAYIYRFEPRECFGRRKLYCEVMTLGDGWVGVAIGLALAIWMLRALTIPSWRRLRINCLLSTDDKRLCLHSTVGSSIEWKDVQQVIVRSRTEWIRFIKIRVDELVIQSFGRDGSPQETAINVRLIDGGIEKAELAAEQLTAIARARGRPTSSPSPFRG